MRNLMRSTTLEGPYSSTESPDALPKGAPNAPSSVREPFEQEEVNQNTGDLTDLKLSLQSGLAGDGIDVK